MNLEKASSMMKQMVQSCLDLRPINEGNNTMTYYTIKATKLRKNPIYFQVYFLTANTLFGYLLPFIFLVWLNVLIMRTLNAAPSEADIMVAHSMILPQGESLSQFQL